MKKLKRLEMMDLWHFKKKFLFIIICLLCMAILGYALLVAAYAIPTEIMQKNMRQSTALFYEDEYLNLMGENNSKLDDFTDALMLLNASHENKNDPLWQQAVNVKRYYVSEMKPNQVLLNIYRDNGKNFSEISYARYWHGYLIFLKPLLALGNYGMIRYILMFLQLGLFAILISQLSIHDKKTIIPTLLMYLFLNPPVIMLSLQFSVCAIITFLALILIVHWNEEWKSCIFVWDIFFLMLGSMTAYFDLLTYPIVTLGIPLTFWIYKNNSNKLEEIFQLIKKSFFYTCGYFGMWSLKWVLGSIITKSDIVKNAFSAIQMRTSTSTTYAKFTAIQAIQMNIKSSTPLLKMIICIEILLLVLTIIRYRKIIWKPAYLIIFLYPFVWYSVVLNHSYVHCWFTYRELAISVYTLGIWSMSAFLEPRENMERVIKSEQ